MQEVYRYGLFQVGQIWRVVCDGQPELAFRSRDAALAAIGVLEREHQLAGDSCELYALDGSSRLVQVEEASAEP